MSSRFRAALHSGRVLLLDGAMYTELMRAGLPLGECGERWNLTRPDAVSQVHQAYVDAGAECLLTNTFQAQPTALAKHGLDVRAVFGAAFRLARSVAGPERFVLADVGPLATADDARAVAEAILADVGRLDGMLVETVTSAYSLPAIRELRSRLEQLPFLLSLSLRRTANGNVATLDGNDIEGFARQALDLEPDALGVNCGRELDVDAMTEVLALYRRWTDMPLFARPNAGTPTRIEEGWSYPLTAETLAAQLPKLLEAGARLVGGCCGTTPDTIAAFRPVVDHWNQKHKRRG